MPDSSGLALAVAPLVLPVLLDSPPQHGWDQALCLDGSCRGSSVVVYIEFVLNNVLLGNCSLLVVCSVLELTWMFSRIAALLP